MPNPQTKPAVLCRCPANPLLTARDVKPTRPDFVVEGIFNCGAAKYQGEYLLLCRVAESVKSPDSDTLCFPVIKTANGQAVFDTVSLKKSEHPDYDFSDPRTVAVYRGGQRQVIWLTSLSHLRLARSQDGIHFQLDDHPSILPSADTECWGMEDPRISCIDGLYCINYTAVCPNGAATALITTRDFQTFTRRGLIFLPENKDVALFPEKLGGKYFAFNRPVPFSIGTPDIWLSESEDLLHWGGHRHFCGVSSAGWENGRIGGGAPPFRTEKGWVKIYHAADHNQRYCLGALLLDGSDPSRILAKSKVPLLEPETDYERTGFFGEVVFTCGCLYEDGVVKLYYGAADDKICRADLPIAALYRHLGV